MMERTERLSAADDGLARAAGLLRSGSLVAFPTETVYGLGGDARSDLAVAGIFEAKGRPHFNPLIVHVPDLGLARALGRMDERAERLAAAFWPGPMTLVLPVLDSTGLSPLVTAGLQSVAIRVPAHPVAQLLLRVFGGPLAAPSANPSGRISPTRADHVLQGLSGRIAAVVDGGACGVGLESTIIGLDGKATLLRPGGLTVEAIEAVLGARISQATETGRPTAPGQLASHYAPAGSVRLEATEALDGEVWIGFSDWEGDSNLNLSPTGNLVEAAASLFHVLRLADSQAGPNGRIAVAPIPEVGLGRAINDRLRRAAAPRATIP